MNKGTSNNESLKNTDPIYYNLDLHNYHNYHHYLQNIASLKCKDQRLDFIEIPNGLIEVLQNTGFTVEKILDSEPSDIAERLGIDPYIGKIIFQETEKTISKINLDLLSINK
jgi:hypothetical protein